MEMFKVWISEVTNIRIEYWVSKIHPTLKRSNILVASTFLDPLVSFKGVLKPNIQDLGIFPEGFLLSRRSDNLCKALHRELLKKVFLWKLSRHFLTQFSQCSHFLFVNFWHPLSLLISNKLFFLTKSSFYFPIFPSTHCCYCLQVRGRGGLTRTMDTLGLVTDSECPIKKPTSTRVSHRSMLTIITDIPWLEMMTFTFTISKSSTAIQITVSFNGKIKNLKLAATPHIQ